jgi:hypothetical protein
VFVSIYTITASKAADSRSRRIANVADCALDASVGRIAGLHGSLGKARFCPLCAITSHRSKKLVRTPCVVHASQSDLSQLDRAQELPRNISMLKDRDGEPFEGGAAGPACCRSASDKDVGAYILLLTIASIFVRVIVDRWSWKDIEILSPDTRATSRRYKPMAFPFDRCRNTSSSSRTRPPYPATSSFA